MEAKEGGRQIRRGNRLGNESIFGRAAPNQRKRVVNDQSGNHITSNEPFENYINYPASTWQSFN